MNGFDLFGNVGVDMRDDIRSIIGFSEMLQMERLGPIGNEQYRGYVEDISKAATRLMKTVNHYMDMARFHAGALELNEEIVDIDAIVQEVFCQIEPQAVARHVDLRWSAPPALPRLYGDRRCLQQILMNTLGKFLFSPPEGSVLEVTVDLAYGMTVIIKHSDARIDPRWVALAALEMLVARMLMERHGGTMTLESTQNQGPALRLSFPAERTVA